MTNKEAYSQFCVNNPVCIYDQPWWLDIDCGEENWDVLLYEEKGKIMAAWPFFVSKVHGINHISVPFRSQHQGVIIDYPSGLSESQRTSLENKVMENLIQQMETVVKEKKICWFLQSFSPDITNWLPFYWNGYHQTTRYTYRIPDIRDPEKVFNSFQRDKCRSIKKARNIGFSILFDLPAKEFYDLHKSFLAKQGRTIKYSYSMFEKYYTGIYKHNQGRTIYAVDSNGHVIGAMLNAWDDKWGYDWISAFDPETRLNGVPDLLVFSMISFLADKVEGYDFEGSMDKGIEHSFRHFGAIQTPYFNISKVYSKNPFLKMFLEQRLKGI